MPEDNNKFFREDEQGYVTMKSAGILKPIMAKLPFLRPSISSGDIDHFYTDYESGIRRHDEIDFNLNYNNGSSLSFFPIGKTIISYNQAIQKGEWIEPDIDRLEDYWGGYGLSYVHIGIPCAVFDWLQNEITDHLSSGDATIDLDEDECDELFERVELGRDNTYVWIIAELSEKIGGTSKDDQNYISSVTHSMLMNRKSAMGRGSIEIQLQRVYEYNDRYSTQVYDWFLLFKINRLDLFQFVDTRFEDDE